MKTLLFLCGPNGVGKTTIAREIVSRLPQSAYVDTDYCRVMHPFVLDDTTIPTIAKNISDLVLNFLHCPVVETVLLTYGFHGRRREVFQRVMEQLSPEEYRFLPFLLWCSEEENRNRMGQDNRSRERVEWALGESRRAVESVPYPRIDLTALSVAQAAAKIIKEAGL